MANIEPGQRKRRQHHPDRALIRSRGYFHRLGPGIVTGAADDDPSGIGTYSQAGAQAGFGFLWATIWLLPFAFAVQEACARVALVTGKGLASIIKSRMPRWVLVLAVALVAIANTVNIAADLSSMSAALRLLVPINQIIGVILFATGIVVAEVLVPYHRYARVLRWLCLSLLAYVAVLFVAKVDWQAVTISTILPHVDFSRTSIEMLIALAGTTISPYLFFWQAAEEVEERKVMDQLHHRKDVGSAHLRAMRGDVFAGMLTGVFIMFAIMVTTGATLNANGITNIASAEDAARALAPVAGQFAGLLFLLGILGVGLLSIPVLAGSTAYALAETFGWRESLELKPREAKAFYLVIIGSVLVAVLLNLVGIPPMTFLFLAAVLNGLAAPALMAIVWILARNHDLLGRWASPLWSRVLLGAATLLMAGLPFAWLFAA
ncbi:MAG: divalent metal cation transporter [Actinomycetales bacterium]|nr:divalent metal cation transporter [Actinomycetales bacterium]